MDEDDELIEASAPENPEKDLEFAIKELNCHLRDYERAERYYEGDEDEKYVSRRLRQMLSGSENDFNVNLASRVVHAVTDRLEISALMVADEDGVPHSVDPGRITDSEDGEQGEVTLAKLLNREIWEKNELDQEAPDIHLKAGVFGDAYMFLWPNEDGGLDLFMHDPKSVRVFYEAEDPRKKRLAIHWWVTDDGYIRVNLWYPDWCVKFKTKTTKTQGLTARSYTRYIEEGTTDEYGVMPNVLGEIPFWHFRTARPYGVPLHKNAYGPQDAITKLVRSMMTITDFASFPQRYALGETGVGSDDDLDWSDDTESPDDAMSQLISGAGEVWWLKGVKNVGQFPEANIDQAIKPLEKFIELMAASTGTPMTYLNKVRGTASTPLSGASQRELESAHLHRVRMIQRSYGATWRSLLSFAVNYLSDSDSATVSIEWAPTYFRDDKETWEGAKAQQDAGVPKRVTLMERGYPEAQVNSWGYTEEEPNGPEPEVDDPFVQNQQAPVRPELRENMDGDTSRFNQNAEE